MAVSHMFTLAFAALFVVGIVALGVSFLGDALGIVAELLPRSLRERSQTATDKISTVLGCFGGCAMTIAAGGFVTAIDAGSGPTVTGMVIGGGLLLFGVALAAGLVRGMRDSTRALCLTVHCGECGHAAPVPLEQLQKQLKSGTFPRCPACGHVLSADKLQAALDELA